MRLVRDDFSVTPKTIIGTYRVKINYMIARSAREFCIDKINGFVLNSYGSIDSYPKDVGRLNEGSMVKYESYNDHFYSCFVAFRACIEEVQWCRPVLTVDACRSKEPYQGQLSTASFLNENSGMTPFCFAILDQEETSNWIWIFLMLKRLFCPFKRT